MYIGMHFKIYTIVEFWALMKIGYADTWAKTQFTIMIPPEPPLESYVCT